MGNFNRYYATKHLQEGICTLGYKKIIQATHFQDEQPLRRD